MSEKTTLNQYNQEIVEWDDSTLDLRPALLRGIFAYGFEKPSPIQKKGLIPLVQPGIKGKRRDILAQAQSGTGKTACFGVGSLQITDSEKKNTQVLILAPTHELASQIKGVVEDIGRFEKIKVQLLVGGTSVDGDREKLDNDTPHIVVGTPGRVHDMIRRKYLKTENIELIVLDEADEMLSQGFKDQIYKIFQYMSNEVQISLFSATIPEALEQLTARFMRNPIKILVKAEQLTLQGIAQYYIRLDSDEHKYATIKDLFDGLTISQAIIYCNSTRRVDDLEEAMVQDEFPVKKIHGKMDEAERKIVHRDFKNGGCRVLITSDLFARGIDVQQVSVVINFDICNCKHTYLHRIGRSARWGRKGLAINFVTRRDVPKIKEIVEWYQTQIDDLPLNFVEKIRTV